MEIKNTCFLLVLLLAVIIQSCTPTNQEKLELQQSIQNQEKVLKQLSKQTESLELLADSLIKIKYSLDSAILLNKHNTMIKYSIINGATFPYKKSLYVVTDTTISGSNSNIVYNKVNASKTDTLKQVSYNLNSGKIAFYCPHEMYYNQTYDAYGMIAAVLSDEDLRLLMFKKIKQHERDSININLNDDNLLIEKIQFYNLLELKLDNTVNTGFDIFKIHNNEKQTVSGKMENWHWKITPTTTIQQQQLILKVIIYDENGVENNYFSKTYHLNIKVRPYAFFYNTKLLFIQNPKWAFGSIIIPFITFFAGRWLQRRNKSEETNT